MRLAEKLFSVFVAAIAVLCLGVLSTASSQTRSGAAKSQLERGRYLVERVGLCSDCHTPRDSKGQFIQSKALQGSPVIFAPAVPVPAWAKVSPPIAGLPGFTDAQAVTFFTTGKDPSGKFARPPMPPYRFNKRDAEAVVAYLRSLAPNK